MCPSAAVNSMDGEDLPKPNTSKIIYLIRHAETEENVCMKGFHDVGRAIKKGRLPSQNDWKLGSQFVGMTLKGVTDSQLSNRGERQVLQLKSILKDRNFQDKLDMIVHSPLRRARETCYGIFGLIGDGGKRPSLSSNGMTTTTETTLGKNIPVVELPCLKELTQLEVTTQGKKPIRKRIRELEDWIAQQDVENIAIVGHSEYFMIMLGLKDKFMNCDVWKVSYEPQQRKWTVIGNEVRLDMFSPRHNQQVGGGGGQDAF